jgi:polyferredoxin
MATVSQPAPPQKKKLTRRTLPDRSQLMRHWTQALFVALNLWLGLQFFFWVRSFQVPGSPQVSRPPGAEGWLPIAGLMNFKYFLSTGRIPAIHPAAMFLFMAFVLMSLLLKKAFCSWLCPVGTLSEFLWKLGRKFFRRNFHLPKWLDIPLRGLKYLLLAFFAFIIGSMSAEALDDFMHAPYALVADVKMLNFFLYISFTGAAIIASLVVLSFLVQNFWCRYLCPYGALMGLVSLLSPVKIRRDTEACIDCAKCAHACPSNLAVDRLVQIRSAECTGCMACVAVCPAQNALQFSLPPGRSTTLTNRWVRRAASPLVVAALLACIFFGFTAYAKASGHWQTNLPRSVYVELVPSANQLSHPGY